MRTRCSTTLVVVVLLAGAAAAPGRAAGPLPPAAEASGGSAFEELTRGSYCWYRDGRSACKRSSSRRGPTIDAVGRRVTFRLGFRPESLRVHVGSRSYRLRPARRAVWRVPRHISGRRFFRLVAKPADGDAEYLGYVRVGG